MITDILYNVYSNMRLSGHSSWLESLDCMLFGMVHGVNSSWNAALVAMLQG